MARSAAGRALKDASGWLASNPCMAGTKLGYDGAYPTFNDERAYRPFFRVVAVD